MFEEYSISVHQNTQRVIFHILLEKKGSVIAEKWVDPGTVGVHSKWHITHEDEKNMSRTELYEYESACEEFHIFTGMNLNKKSISRCSKQGPVGDRKRDWRIKIEKIR